MTASSSTKYNKSELPTQPLQDGDSPRAQATSKIIHEKFQELKSVFETRSVSKEAFAKLYKIVVEALDDGDIGLAVNAAIYDVGWFGYVEVPEEASWNTILHRVVRHGEFPPTDFKVKFLEPREYGFTSGLSRQAKQIWSFLKENNWDVPGFEVIFDAYGKNPNEEKPLCAWKVAGIRGEDFYLGFCGIQGRMENDWTLNNTGGLSFVAVPGFTIRFFEDGSGPTIHEYHGEDWSEAVRGINSPY